MIFLFSYIEEFWFHDRLIVQCGACILKSSDGILESLSTSVKCAFSEIQSSLGTNIGSEYKAC